MWTITEFVISEHKTEFKLDLARGFEIVAVLPVAQKPPDGTMASARSFQIRMYLRSSIGQK